MAIPTVLIVIAVILWFLAAVNWPTSPVALGWLGLFFYGLSLLVGKL